MNTHSFSKSPDKLLLLLLILIQLCYTTWIFGTQKEGFHSDEIFSYGLSNSYYQPYFGIPGDAEDMNAPTFLQYPDGTIRFDLEKTGYIDVYQWISGTKYRDYLTVQPDQRFAYDSVVYNQSLDLHPPVYYMLLHTVCSLFPNTFSPWYAYIFNALFLAGTQIFLYLTAKRISNSWRTALLSCLLYGGSTGALSTFLFLRQYGMQTMLCMLFTYVAVLIYYRESSSFKETRLLLLSAILIAYLAFMTHLYSIVYIGTFTAFYCLNLLFRRHWKKMLHFGCSMVVSLGLFMLSWSHVFFQTNSYDKHVLSSRFSPVIQFKMLLRMLCRTCFGFSIHVLRTSFWNIVLPPLIALCIAIPLLLLPFRDEIWCQKIFKALKGIPRRLNTAIHRTDFITLVIVLGALSIYVVSSVATDVVNAGEFIIRYIMPTLPLFCMTAVIWIETLLKHLPRLSARHRLITMVLVCVAVIRTHVVAPSPFILTHFDVETDTATLLEDKNVVVLYDYYNQTFRYSNWLAPYLRHTRNDFLVSADLLGYYWNDINSLGEHIDYALVYYRTLKPDEANTEYANHLIKEYIASPYTVNTDLELLDVADDFSEEKYNELITPDSSAFDIGSSDPDQITAEALVTLDCSNLLNALNGGCNYQIIQGVNIQNSLFYLIKFD